ncbi:MAG: glycosyltransferase family 4 protein [Acidimicrobiales bacterium]
MRIAQIAPPWTPVPPPLYGGIELVVDLLCRGLQDAGHEVLLYTVGESTCPVPKQWVLPAAAGTRIGSAVPEIRHVLHAYEAVQGFDIVHDHTVFGPIYSERYPHLPVVTTIHGPFNDELTDLYRMVADRVPILCVSHDQRSTAPTVPVERVIHHGVEAAAFPVGEGDGGYCLFLGRMAAEKGAHRAIAACRKAGVPLLMAAKMREPWERAYFDAEVAPLLSDDIRYLGEVPHEEKLQLLAGARALVNPIRWHEPFGLVMIEALACGTPVIAFPEGAAPEIVENGRTGWLCDDESEMAHAIGQIDALDRGACRAAVEGYFSVERMVEQHIELFEHVLAERR